MLTFIITALYPGRFHCHVSLTKCLDKTISCVETDWQFPSLTQDFMSFLPSILMAERLYIHGTANNLPQDVEDIQLLELAPAFATVRNLYVPMEFAEFFGPILQERVGETTADVLPALESLFRRGPAIGTSPGSPGPVCRCTTAYRSPFSHFLPELMKRVIMSIFDKYSPHLFIHTSYSP